MGRKSVEGQGAAQGQAGNQKEKAQKAERLTKNFSASEFLCPCGRCSGGRMSQPFMDRLQALRDMYGQPVTIVRGGGYRCPAYNKAVGGADDSTHPLGQAADCEVIGGANLYHFLRCAYSVGFTGIGINNGSVHVDDRKAGVGVAWTYYKKKKK